MWHKTYNNVLVDPKGFLVVEDKTISLTNKAKNGVWKRFATLNKEDIVVEEFEGVIERDQCTWVNHIIGKDEVILPREEDQTLYMIELHFHDWNCDGDVDWITLPNGERILVRFPRELWEKFKPGDEITIRSVGGKISIEDGHMPNPNHKFKYMRITSYEL